MGLVVTGISQNGDISALEASLTAAGHGLEHIQLINPDDSAGSLVGRLAGANIMTGDTGTGVPGMGGGMRGYQTFRNESLTDRLGDFEIPDSEVDNYVEALEAGRSVVAFFAKPDTVEAVADLFREAGLAKVKVF